VKLAPLSLNCYFFAKKELRMARDSILTWMRSLGEKGRQSELELLIQNTPVEEVRVPEVQGKTPYILSLIYVYF